jgi:hypothetical protein
VPPDKAVPLFKWPKALKCRREQTIKKPIDFKLKIRVEIKNDDVQDNMSDWMQQRQNFV